MWVERTKRMDNSKSISKKILIMYFKGGTVAVIEHCSTEPVNKNIKKAPVYYKAYFSITNPYY
jgi:hypothetical protein